MNCNYCLRNQGDVYKVQLRVYSACERTYEWQKPILICKGCKRSLRGVFKYYSTKFPVNETTD